MLDDLRFGWRILHKHPGTTAVAWISLALGIGASTAMFSVIHAVLLNPFPYRDADRIVGIDIVPLKSGLRRGVIHGRVPGDPPAWQCFRGPHCQYLGRTSP